MALTLIRPVHDVRNSDTYTDTIAPTLANFETNPTNQEQDLNNLRSMINHLKGLQIGNWSDVITTPVTFEGGAQRGINSINQDLHDYQRKRMLQTVREYGKDITVGGGANFAVLGVGQLPTSLTINTSGGNTLGAMAAFHSGVFGTHALDVIGGANALEPLNLCTIVDGNTGDAIKSGTTDVKALLQFETNVDPGTASDLAPNRLQLSFVRANGTLDGLEAVPFADIAGRTINYFYRQQHALQDLPRTALLGDSMGEGVAGSTISRQTAYDNQGTTVVTLNTNATLDLNSAGIAHTVRDLVGANLFAILEGSGTASSRVTIAGAVDLFSAEAVVNDFANGIQARTTGTRPINIGVNDGQIETIAGPLELQAATLLAFDDGNKPGSWVNPPGIDFSLIQADWDDYKTEFGEIPLLRAITLAAQSGGGGGPGLVRGTKTYADVTVDILANIDAGGVGGGGNLSVQLPDLSIGVFAQHDIELNGRRQEPGADATADNDYYPGASLANGQTRWEKTLIVGDKISVVTWS